MKTKNRTIKSATFRNLDKNASLAMFHLGLAGHTVSIYHGKEARITKSWRSVIAQIESLRAATKIAFKDKISN